MKPHEHLMFPAKCPWCGHTLDAATFPSGRTEPPRAGDLSVCMNCARALRFASVAGITVPEKLTTTDMRALPHDVIRNLARTAFVIAQFNKTRK